MERPLWAPAGVDPGRASAARMYDYYLGGCHHFPVDAQAADEVIRLLPQTPAIMRANRQFLRRAVSWSAQQGIAQFLDLGAGIPTQGPVHEVARRTVPDARVVYVDSDEVAVAHARQLVGADPDTEVLHQDLRDVAAVLRDPRLRRLLDLRKPTALLLVSVLQFIPDHDRPARIVAGYRDALAPSSHLILSHATADGLERQAPAISDLYARTSNPIRYRTRAEVAAMFDGFTLVEPGLVHLTDWRLGPAGDTDENLPGFGAAGVGLR